MLINEITQKDSGKLPLNELRFDPNLIQDTTDPKSKTKYTWDKNLRIFKDPSGRPLDKGSLLYKTLIKQPVNRKAILKRDGTQKNPSGRGFLDKVGDALGTTDAGKKYRDDPNSNFVGKALSTTLGGIGGIMDKGVNAIAKGVAGGINKFKNRNNPDTGPTFDQEQLKNLNNPKDTPGIGKTTQEIMDFIGPKPELKVSKKQGLKGKFGFGKATTDHVWRMGDKDDQEMLPWSNLSTQQKNALAKHMGTTIDVLNTQATIWPEQDPTKQKTWIPNHNLGKKIEQRFGMAKRFKQAQANGQEGPVKLGWQGVDGKNKQFTNKDANKQDKNNPDDDYANLIKKIQAGEIWKNNLISMEVGKWIMDHQAKTDMHLNKAYKVWQTKMDQKFGDYDKKVDRHFNYERKPENQTKSKPKSDTIIDPNTNKPYGA